MTPHHPFRGRDAVAAGCLSSRQLRGSGVQRLFRGIYVDAGATVDLALRARAAALLKPDAVIGGYAAAELLGASCGPADAPVELIVATSTAPQAGLVLREDVLPADAIETTTDGIRVTSYLQTAFDLARTRERLDAVIALDALSRVGGFHPRAVVRFGYRHVGARGTARLPSLVRLADRRSGSPMETRIRMAIVDGGLPCPVLQHPVGRYFLDLAYPGARLGIEFDGAHHRTADQALYDLERQAFFSEAKWKIVRFRAAAVLGAPHNIPARVAAELAQRG